MKKKKKLAEKSLVMVATSLVIVAISLVMVATSLVMVATSLVMVATSLVMVATSLVMVEKSVEKSVTYGRTYIDLTWVGATDACAYKNKFTGHPIVWRAV